MSKDGKNEKLPMLGVGEADNATVVTSIGALVADSRQDFVNTVDAAKSTLRGVVTTLEAVGAELNRTADIVISKNKETAEVDLIALDAINAQIGKVVETLGKVTKQYFALNYTPTGEVSISDLIRKKVGTSENPAGRGAGKIAGVTESISEVDPSDVISE